MSLPLPAALISVSPDAVAALRAQPHFAEALRTSAVGMVTLYQGRRLLNWLLDDRGQLVFSYSALYLHFTRDPDDPASGLTPTRIKALCKELDICSAGRTTAMLHLMRWAGYVAPDKNVADGRRRPLVATERLVGMLCERWRWHFAAMAPLFPDGERLLSSLDDPAFIRAFMIAMEMKFRAGFRFANDPNFLRLIQRNAGILILMSLIADGEAEDTVPPSRPIVISISALARRFAVSRAHVIDLLDDAAAAGLIERRAEQSQILIRPRLANELCDAFARMCLCYADCARVALQEIEIERTRASGTKPSEQSGAC